MGLLSVFKFLLQHPECPVWGQWGQLSRRGICLRGEHPGECPKLVLLARYGFSIIQH